MLFASPTIDSINQTAASLLNALVEVTLLSSLLVIAIALLFRMAPKVSAATRHFALLLAIVSPLLLPVVASVLPKWRVLPRDVLAAFPADAVSIVAPAASLVTPQPAAGLTNPEPTALAAGVQGAVHQLIGPEASAYGSAKKSDSSDQPAAGLTNPEPTALAAGVQGGVHQLIGPEASAYGSAKKSDSSDQPAARWSWASWICVLWIAGVLLSLSVWGAGLSSLSCLKRRSMRSCDCRIDRLLAEASARIGVQRRVQVIVSERRQMPMQWGVLRPLILLPAEAHGWSRDTIETVLLHELAHVKRYDSLAQGFALLGRSLLWFHPLVWWSVDRLRCECERACDDLLLSIGSNACDYADTLLSVTRSSRAAQRPMLAALGMSTSRELERRIRGILDSTQKRYSLSRRATWVICGCFGCVLSAAAVLRSQEAAAAAARPASAAPSPAKEMEQPGRLIRIGHVDDTAEGRRSIAGSGHAVRFDRPENATRVAAIELFASRYGTVDAPNEDFHIYLLDEKRQLIAAYPVTYGQIARGAERWYTLPIRACEVPKQFYVAVAFNPHRTKGIYLGYDESAQSSNSFIGRPTTGFEAVDENREWMIRAVMIDQHPPANPFQPPASPLEESAP